MFVPADSADVQPQFQELAYGSSPIIRSEDSNALLSQMMEARTSTGEELHNELVYINNEMMSNYMFVPADSADVHTQVQELAYGSSPIIRSEDSNALLSQIMEARISIGEV